VNQQQLVSCLGLAGFVMVVVAQPVRADTVKVSAIELKPTRQGIEIVLRTTDSKRLQVFASSYRNTFVANVLNSQLQLPSGNAFRQSNPIEGIAAVTVNSVGANSIRIIVTGKTELPKAQVRQSDASGGLRQRALVLSLTAPADTTATQPTPKPSVPEAVEPESPTKPEETPPEEDNVIPQEPAQTEDPPQTAEGEKEIEILVTGEQEEGYSIPNATTGTRTDTPIRDIPQSIQVIPEQVLEEQQVTRIDEALRNVSGVTFRGIDTQSRGIDFSIRGFEDAPVLRDGFRTYINQPFPEVANLERIEVLKGPA
jgi:iron complex outermembrane receptor protein